MNAEPHRLAWSPVARRALTRLPEKVATAVVEFAYGTLAENPPQVGHRLHLDLHGYHSARRGDYRVIYRIEEAEHRVEIVDIDHRADVYRPR